MSDTVPEPGEERTYVVYSLEEPGRDPQQIVFDKAEIAGASDQALQAAVVHQDRRQQAVAALLGADGLATLARGLADAVDVIDAFAGHAALQVARAIATTYSQRAPAAPASPAESGGAPDSGQDASPVEGPQRGALDAAGLRRGVHLAAERLKPALLRELERDPATAERVRLNVWRQLCLEAVGLIEERARARGERGRLAVTTQDFADAFADHVAGPDLEAALDRILPVYTHLTGFVQGYVAALDLEQRPLRELEELLRPEARPPPLSPAPLTLPQQTFQEARTLGVALANLPRRTGWREVEGESALFYEPAGAPLAVRLNGHPLLEQLPWLDLPPVPAGVGPAAARRAELDNLWTVAGQLRTDAVLLQHVVVGLLLEHHDRLHVTVELASLVRELGWEPQTAVQGREQRRRIWLWLHVLAAMPVIGRRDGRWTAPGGKVIQTDSTSVFLTISARHDPSRARQTSFDPTDPPWAVSLAAGPWLDQWRGNASMLSYFGDLRALARIPSGKPSGAWARSVGLALHQLWRDRAARTQIARVGAEKTPTVRLPRRFTRPELLDLFPVAPPHPTWEEVLRGDHPRRAWDYWDEAIRLLKRAVVGHYAETPARSPAGPRRDRSGEFKQQQLDVRPKADGVRAIAEIVDRAKAAKARRAKRKAPSPPDGEG